jgi:hypothetical protein
LKLPYGLDLLPITISANSSLDLDSGSPLLFVANWRRRFKLVVKTKRAKSQYSPTYKYVI